MILSSSWGPPEGCYYPPASRVSPVGSPSVDRSQPLTTMYLLWGNILTSGSHSR